MKVLISCWMETPGVSNSIWPMTFTLLHVLQGLVTYVNLNVKNTSGVPNSIWPMTFLKVSFLQGFTRVSNTKGQSKCQNYFICCF